MMKGFSYLLCVIGKLNEKLYDAINNYHTDVCFQFHPVNSTSNKCFSQQNNCLSSTLINNQIGLFDTLP